jgi:hypothetical protein
MMVKSRRRRRRRRRRREGKAAGFDGVLGYS